MILSVMFHVLRVIAYLKFDGVVMRVDQMEVILIFTVIEVYKNYIHNC